MGQDNGIELTDVELGRFPIHEPQALDPLKQAAVDKHAGRSRFEQELGSGYGPGGAVESKSSHKDAAMNLRFDFRSPRSVDANGDIRGRPSQRHAPIR